MHAKAAATKKLFTPSIESKAAGKVDEVCRRLSDSEQTF